MFGTEPVYSTFHPEGALGRSHFDKTVLRNEVPGKKVLRRERLGKTALRNQALGKKILRKKALDKKAQGNLEETKL